MTELTYTLPEIGEPSVAADPRTLTALQNIKTWAEGQITSINLKAEGVEGAAIKKEAITEAKLSTAVAALLNAKTSGLEVKAYSAGATLKSGELAVQEKTGETFTLPAVGTVNQRIGIFSAVAETKIATTAGALIVGDFTSATTAKLTTLQHLEVQSNGTSWLIIAGEPKRTGGPTEVLKAQTAEAAPHEASATRPALVTVVPSGAITLFVAGETVLSGATVSTYTFWLQPGQVWAYTGAATTSTYFIQ